MVLPSSFSTRQRFGRAYLDYVLIRKGCLNLSTADLLNIHYDVIVKQDYQLAPYLRGRATITTSQTWWEAKQEWENTT